MFLRKGAAAFIIQNYVHSLLDDGIHGPHVVKQPRKVPDSRERLKIFVRKWSFRHEHVSDSLAHKRRYSVVKTYAIFRVTSHGLRGSMVVDNCRQAFSRMAGMAKGRKEVLISDVYSRLSVWREGDVNFRHKDVTKKL